MVTVGHSPNHRSRGFGNVVIDEYWRLGVTVGINC